VAKQSFGNKRVPKLELGNELKFWLSFPHKVAGNSSVMKATIRIAFVCLAANLLIPRPLGAASDAARELDQLTADRDKAIVNAAAPINRMYQTALEALQQRATQANDLDTALRIKQALERLSAKAEILGRWDFINHADGVKYVAEFKPDQTFLWDGRQVGVWDTDGKKIIITHYNRGGHSDYYSLPVRDGKLDGSNTHGDKVTITRKAD
jgi:hypothetical protein